MPRANSRFVEADKSAVATTDCAPFSDKLNPLILAGFVVGLFPAVLPLVVVPALTVGAGYVGRRVYDELNK